VKSVLDGKEHLVGSVRLDSNLYSTVVFVESNSNVECVSGVCHGAESDSRSGRVTVSLTHVTHSITYKMHALHCARHCRLSPRVTWPDRYVNTQHHPHPLLLLLLLLAAPLHCSDIIH